MDKVNVLASQTTSKEDWNQTLRHSWRLTRHPLDFMAYIFIAGGAGLAIPQIIRIFETQNASGLAIESWIGWSLFGVFWLLYGHVRKLYPIMLGSFAKIFLNALVVYGIILYGTY